MQLFPPGHPQNGPNVMQRDIALQAISAVIAKIIMKASNFIVIFVLARALDKHGFGLYGVFVSSLLLISAFGNIGVRQSSAYLVGQKRLTDGEALGGMFFLWPFMSIIGGGLVWIILNRTVGYQDIQLAGPAWFGFSVFLLILFCQGLFMGRNEIRWLNMVDVLPRLLLVPMVLFAVFFGNLDSVSSLWIFASCMAATALVGLYVAWPSAARPTLRFAAIGQLIIFGWPYALALSVSQLNLQITILMIGAKLDAAEAGYFFLASRINGLPVESAVAMALVLFSHSARATDAHEALRRSAQLVSWAMLLVLLFAGLMYVLAPWIVPIVFGADQARAAGILRILLFGLPGLVLAVSLYPVLGGLGRSLLGATATVPAVVVHGVLCWYLIDVAGAKGAAVAAVFGYTIWAIGLLVVVRQIGVSPWIFFRPEFRKLWSLRQGLIMRRTG